MMEVRIQSLSGVAVPFRQRRRATQIASPVRRTARPSVIRASADDLSFGEFAAAFTEKAWDSRAQSWTAFLAVKGKKGFSDGFMLQNYASPTQLLTNGIALSVPSSPKDAGRRLMCNVIHFRQNYLIVGAFCLLLSAFPRPFELLFLASAALAVASISNPIFDRIWVSQNKEQVFKYLPFETPRKLTGELVGGEKAVFGVPRVLFQAVGLIGTAFALSRMYSTLPGLFIAAMLYFIPTLLVHAVLRPIDLFGGGSWTELASSVKRKALLNSLGRALTKN